MINEGSTLRAFAQFEAELASHRPPSEITLPVSWLNRAAVLPGSALVVAIAIWYRFTFLGKKGFKIRQAHFSLWGVSKDSARRGIIALNNAGLISAIRRSGKRYELTIIGPWGNSEAPS